MELRAPLKKITKFARYPGVPLPYFKLLFQKIEEALKLLRCPAFPSPYSLIPLITQAMGLEVPMLGTGNSPYSLISYFAGLKENVFLNNDSGLTYQQRREIIDEVYNMLAPYLLQEQLNYIELLATAKYKRELSGFTSQEITEFKNVLKKKFEILHHCFSKISFSGGDFAHIAHYGYPEDLHREQGFLLELGTQTATLWRENSFPIVTEMQLCGFDAPNKCIRGWFIFMPNYTEELLQNKTLRQKKLLQAGMLAKKLNAKFAGMAGLVASFSKGGKYLSDNIQDFGFTTGHAYTIANIYEILMNIAKKVSLDLSRCKVAVVGAAGSIGSGVSKLIAENDIKEIMLIDTPNMVSVNKLAKLKDALVTLNPSNAIKISKTLDDIGDADVIIVATNSSSAIIGSDHLKPGTIIIDDSFPKNVRRDVLKEREDIILLEGGVTQAPLLTVDASRHLPDLLDLSISKLVSCRQAYGCLAETFVLAALRRTSSYSLGDADTRLAKDIFAKSRRMGFKSTAFQSFGFVVEDSRIEWVEKIIKSQRK